MSFQPDLNVELYSGHKRFPRRLVESIFRCVRGFPCPGPCLLREPRLGCGRKFSDNLIVNTHIVGRISLTISAPSSDCLPDQWKNLFQISIDHIASRFLIGLKDQRLDHERHRPAITFRLDFENILNALSRTTSGCSGMRNKFTTTHEASRRSKFCSTGLSIIRLNKAGKNTSINVRNIRAQNQSRFFFPG